MDFWSFLNSTPRFSAYLCELCVKDACNSIFAAEITEVRREHREGWLNQATTGFLACLRSEGDLLKMTVL